MNNIKKIFNKHRDNIIYLLVVILAIFILSMFWPVINETFFNKITEEDAPKTFEDMRRRFVNNTLKIVNDRPELLEKILNLTKNGFTPKEALEKIMNDNPDIFPEFPSVFDYDAGKQVLYIKKGVPLEFTFENNVLKIKEN